MRRLLTKKSVKWGIAVVCVLALTGGAFAWQARSGREAPAGEVVAEVNGETISSEELENEMQYQMSMMGATEEDLDEEMQDQIRDQVLNNMVSRILLQQEARERDVDVPDERVEEELEAVIENNFEGDEDAFDEALDENDMTKEELLGDIEEQLRMQVFIENYTEDYLAERDDDVSEEEMRDLYESRKEEMEDPPEFEEMKPDLREEILRSRESEALDELLAELREEGDVQIHQQ